MRATDRDGAAIAAVVVMLLAMQVLAHGVLLGALQEWAATRAAVSVLQSRWMGEGAVRRVLGVPFALYADSVPIGDARPLSVVHSGRTHATVTAERLSAEAWLLRGSGGVDGWAGSMASARLMWVLDPVERVAAFRAVVHQGDGGAGGPAGQVTTDVLHDSLAANPICARWFAALDSLLPTHTLEAFASDTTDALKLGLLTGTTLAALAEVETADSVTPMPVVRAGRCADEEPHNWGDPESPTGACGDHFVFRAGSGSLRMVGGVGQGLLLVTEDLVLEAGADFRGIVLVGGSLRVESGSHFQGLARVGGAVEIDESAGIVGSACSAVRALAAAHDRLGVTVPYPEWGWLTSVRE